MKRLLRQIILAVAFSSVLFSASITSAQSPSATNGLEISPALVEINADKNNVYSVDIKVINITQSTLLFESFVDDFGAKNETGVPGVLLEPNAKPLPTSIKTWVTPIPSFSLAPGQEKKIKATITVPTDAEPGGHYGVIRFSGHEGTKGNGNVTQIASAGTLILMNVSGNVVESLEIASFTPSKNNHAGYFFENGPLVFVSRFTNTGSVHVKPIGQIEIKNLFGNPIASLPVNEAGGNVLPNSTRRFESTLNKTWMLGQYTADISIAYGNTGQAIVKTISFWVIPWKIILAALLVIATFVYILRILIKRYNKYIIEKDKNSRKK